MFLGIKRIFRDFFLSFSMFIPHKLPFFKAIHVHCSSFFHLFLYKKSSTSPSFSRNFTAKDYTKCINFFLHFNNFKSYQFRTFNRALIHHVSWWIENTFLLNSIYTIKDHVWLSPGWNDFILNFMIIEPSSLLNFMVNVPFAYSISW